jgi:hypothetical protein
MPLILRKTLPRIRVKIRKIVKSCFLPTCEAHTDIAIVMAIRTTVLIAPNVRLMDRLASPNTSGYVDRLSV